MAATIFNEFKRASAAAYLVGADMRIALLMTNTTADTENDSITNVDDFTTLDEFDGANYVRKALATEAVNRDDASDRSEFDADDVTFTALGAGTRSIAGILVFKFVTNDADSIPASYLGFTAAKSGTLTTRTDDNTGVIALSTGHGVVTSDVVTVTWDGGKRVGMTCTVSGDNVTVDGGTGNPLPATAISAIVIHKLAPKTPDGSDFLVQWNAEGIMQFA